MAKKKSNVAKGKDSYDAQIGGELVAFFNKNITPYATEVGGPAFDLIPVQKQKDIMVNVARMHAEQEYDRIMDLVKVLQKQADDIKRILYITDAVHAAEYQFQVYHGQTYWLCFDSKINRTRLCHQGPKDWTTGAPEHYSYIAPVKWLGDYTWIEVATTQTSENNTEQS
jgi:hypothetical protein